MKPVNEFIPLRTAGLSCYDNSVLSIVNWEKGEYYKAFMYSWRFRFTNDDCVMESFESILQRLYQVYVKRIEEKDPKRVREIIAEELANNRVVLVKGDEFYCPWTYNYKKNHDHSHVYLIVGQKENGFRCVDTLPLAYNEDISIEEFENGFVELSVYRLGDDSDQDDDHGMEYLKKCIKEYQILENLCLSEMDILNEHIKNTSMDELFEEDENVWDTTMYKFFERVYGGRVQFLEFLERISNGDAIISHYTSVMERIVDEWGLIITLITKAFLHKKDMEKVHKTIIPHLCNAIDLEKNLYSEMTEDRLCMEMTDCDQQKELRQIFVDLKDYKHYKELYFDKEHIVTYKEIPVNQIWNVEGMKFDFQVYGEYDCICCEGQEIKVPVDRYDYIMFLGYAIYENQVDDVTIVYSDHSEDKIMVEFTDWASDPRHGIVTAWEGDCESLDDGSKYRGKIFAKKFRLPQKASYVESILLPINPQSRIYAITLAQIASPQEKG